MKKFLSALLLLLLGSNMYAQRYISEQFTDDQITVSYDIQYGTNSSVLTTPPGGTVPLEMDVYQPNPSVDTETARPVIIITHGGSFLPGVPQAQPVLPLGTRSDFPLVAMARRFARMGYVAVIMSYRTGWNALAATQDDRAEGIIRAAFRSFHDGKGVVRYLKNDARNGNNTYKIDPSKIAFAGSQAGGYVPLGMLFLDKGPELGLESLRRSDNNNQFIDFTQPTCLCGNDFEGTSGPIASNVDSRIHVGISLGGAVPDTLIIEGGEVPVLSMHGDADPVTPYNTAIVIPAATGQPIIEVAGGADFILRAQNVGNQSRLENFVDPYNYPWADKDKNGSLRRGLYTFKGAGFQPYAWYAEQVTSTNPVTIVPHPNRAADSIKAQAYLDTVVNYLAPRLNHLFYVNPLDVEQGTDAISQFLNVYPNPASTNLTLNLVNPSIKFNSFELLDVTGRVVRSVNSITNNYHLINVEGLTPGIYLIHLNTSEGSSTKKVIIQ